MSKLCSQCEKENPNSANVCMFCGTRFVENAETDKIDALHKELSEAKDTIKVLKETIQLLQKALAEAQGKTGSTGKMFNDVKVNNNNISQQQQKENAAVAYDEGVVINGVKWATRNVDKPGTFAAKPEDAGMFYQWNRKKAWPATGMQVTGWNSSNPTGNFWEKVNDPSPAGWRVPTSEEFKKLLDKNKVKSEWTSVNGINGYKFIDKTTGNTLFLPAAGYRYDHDGSLNYAGSGGYYWSGTAIDESSADGLRFGSIGADWNDWYYRNYGRSVRSVAE